MDLYSKTSLEISKCILAQKKLCEERKLPHFAPENGRCWSCNRNIYQNYDFNGSISKGNTGEKFITGCPHCNRSYCD